MRFFVHLWERGWIYRANRIVNWCPFHETAISDLEVEHEEVDDALTYARYPFADGSGSHHDRDRAAGDDPRRRGRRRASRRRALPRRRRQAGASSRTSSARVPVIADERVEPEFGTGALKVTPGHDPIDFEIGRDHGLPELTVIGPDGRMNEEAGDLAGLDAAGGGRARPRLAEGARPAREARELPPRGRHVRALPHADRAARSRCSGGARWRSRASRRSRRCASAASATTRSRSTQFAIRSLEEIPDWNISRQLWWGHQLPLWYCPDGHVTCAWPAPEACAECGSRELERDPDVLDTWFSSALWPFATLGWPEETPELRRYYPGDVNSTAREIIRLWENRMIWTGLELMGDVPFHDVIIHSTVLAPDGRRMSKSLGTGIDPLDVIADARRRRDPLRAAEDVVDAGRPLLRGGDRGGAQAREQALERRAADPRSTRGDAGRSGRRRSRSAGSSPGSTRRAREVEAALGARSTSRRRCRRSTTSRSTTSATGTPRRSSRACTTDDADAAATALAALERLLDAAAPGDAARDRGDLVALPRARGRLIVAPWPEPDDASRPTRTRSSACRRRPRSSAAAACSSTLDGDDASGSSTPSSGPSGSKRTATSTPSASACARRSRAPSGCSRTSASSRNVRPPRSSRRSARSSRALSERESSTARLGRDLR